MILPDARTAIDSLRFFEGDVNFAEADSDLHRRNRSNASRSGAEWSSMRALRRERIRNVNVV